MARVSYAIRKDPSTIFMLQDAGKRYGQYCQISTFVKNVVRPEFLNQYLFFAPYSGSNGKYRGSVTDLRLSLEDNNCSASDNYVALIDSEVEFLATPTVIGQLSKTYMPVWGVKSYLDYFEGKKSGVLLFLRVFKVKESLDPIYLEKGSRGSAQVLKLYDSNGNEFSKSVHDIDPIISENRFNYIKDEILHILKVENSLISIYDRSEKGIRDLKNRVEIDKLLQGTHDRWENKNLQWLNNEDDYEDFDMAQLDYDQIYNKCMAIKPNMKIIIDYIKNVKPARLGEYDILLKDLHSKNEKTDYAEKRLFDISMRSALKNALYSYQNRDMDLEEAFQIACIGIATAIQKHSDTVEGLFPSYASMWMKQTMDRELPYYQYNVRLPAHYKENLDTIVKEITRKLGIFEYKAMGIPELYDILMSYTDLGDEKARLAASVLAPAISIHYNFINSKGETILSNQLYEEGINHHDDEIVRSSLSCLTERERDIIEKRYGFYNTDEKTLEEIGAIYGMTRERVRQIEKKAMFKILSYLHKIKYISKSKYDKTHQSKFKKF